LKKVFLKPHKQVFIGIPAHLRDVVFDTKNKFGTANALCICVRRYDTQKQHFIQGSHKD
jgi:hypothetical protein